MCDKQQVNAMHFCVRLAKIRAIATIPLPRARPAHHVRLSPDFFVRLAIAASRFHKTVVYRNCFPPKTASTI